MYDELVKRLREVEEMLRVAQFNEAKSLIKEASDVIEELVRKEKFHTFLWNVINPNEIEQYIKMYNSKGIPVCGFPESPKEE